MSVHFTTNIDKLREQRHRQYAVELRDAGWVVLHESDFTVESFHTDPYFRAVVERIVRWYEHPVDAPTPEELAFILKVIGSPLVGFHPQPEGESDATQ